jgi:hypothetical protein
VFAEGVIAADVIVQVFVMLVGFVRVDEIVSRLELVVTLTSGELCSRQSYYLVMVAPVVLCCSAIRFVCYTQPAEAP